MHTQGDRSSARLGILSGCQVRVHTDNEDCSDNNQPILPMYTSMKLDQQQVRTFTLKSFHSSVAMEVQNGKLKGRQQFYPLLFATIA